MYRQMLSNVADDPSFGNLCNQLAGPHSSDVDFETSQTQRIVIFYSAMCAVGSNDHDSWIDLDILVDGVAVPPSDGDNAFCSSTGDAGAGSPVYARTNVALEVAPGIHHVDVFFTLRSCTSTHWFSVGPGSVLVISEQEIIPKSCQRGPRAPAEPQAGYDMKGDALCNARPSGYI